MTLYEKAKRLLEEGELDQSHNLLSELIDQHGSRLERPEADQISEDHKSARDLLLLLVSHSLVGY